MDGKIPGSTERLSSSCKKSGTKKLHTPLSALGTTSVCLRSDSKLLSSIESTQKEHAKKNPNTEIGCRKVALKSVEDAASLVNSIAGILEQAKKQTSLNRLKILEKESNELLRKLHETLNLDSFTGIDMRITELKKVISDFSLIDFGVKASAHVREKGSAPDDLSKTLRQNLIPSEKKAAQAAAALKQACRYLKLIICNIEASKATPERLEELLTTCKSIDP